MRTYYIIVVSVLLVVLGMLSYPTIHNVVISQNVTDPAKGFLPLTSSAVTLLPYAFLGFIAYAIIKLSGR